METQDLLIVAAGVFLFALVSRKGESGSITAPMVFTLFGFLMGASGLLNLSVGNEFINRMTEITLVLVLFADAARIDIRRLGAEHDVPIRLLSIGLPLTILFGAGVALWLFPEMNLWQAAVLAVVLAPTDAALGQAVVTNEHIPVRVRQGLNVESGLNDGLAFPILLIVLSFALASEPGRSFDEWMTFLLRQVVLGPLAGAAVAFCGIRLVEFCASKEWMNQMFLQISVLSLAILAFGSAELIGGNGFIAAFTAGAFFGSASRRVLGALEEFGETEGQLLTLLVFLLFGAVLLPPALASLEWRHLVYALLSLTVIRMLPMAISLVGTRLLPTTVGFLGWFGPRGLASILYLLYVLEIGELEGSQATATTVLITVLLSILLHGASASPAAQRYGAFISALDKSRTGSERRPVFPFPTRILHSRAKDNRVE